MVAMRRFTGVCIVLLVLSGAAFAQDARAPRAFPKIRYGIGNEPTTGGGYFAGRPYRTRDAAIAWSRQQRSLTLYFLLKRGVKCSGLIKYITHRPGRLIQAYIKARPVKRLVGRPVPNQTIEFITYPASHDVPLKDQGLKQGAKLVLTSIDSYPRGIWHGSLSIPTKPYANGLVYGYQGTFAAHWCDLRRE